MSHNKETEQKVRENRRKIELLVELIEANARHREANGSYGEVTIREIWQAGHLKEVRFVEEIIIRDLPEVKKAYDPRLTADHRH